ncbi:uncharacterized protein LOC112407012 [Neophocaena asiaeorientalis asiaeorientalis]|uniref:Uncharacterized protein LOC112407012 n=1 Tax=Neophocaena asiaeorientalis asiaeorientalis TaxID=1706337 RepID=A0A341CBU0_NEOAA|nr:uncharacterized protein LOC112407012 [Neophocaena asiaeorientalis asiaeorientalis]
MGAEHRPGRLRAQAAHGHLLRALPARVLQRLWEPQEPEAQRGAHGVRLPGPPTDAMEAADGRGCRELRPSVGSRAAETFLAAPHSDLVRLLLVASPGSGACGRGPATRQVPVKVLLWLLRAGSEPCPERWWGRAQRGRGLAVAGIWVHSAAAAAAQAGWRAPGPVGDGRGQVVGFWARPVGRDMALEGPSGWQLVRSSLWPRR